jgi:hypothetical protein
MDAIRDSMVSEAPLVGESYTAVNGVVTSSLVAIPCQALIEELEYHPVRSLFVYQQTLLNQIHTIARLAVIPNTDGKTGGDVLGLMDPMLNASASTTGSSQQVLKIRCQPEYAKQWTQFQRQNVPSPCAASSLSTSSQSNTTQQDQPPLLHFFGRLERDSFYSANLFVFHQVRLVSNHEARSCLNWFEKQCAADIQSLRRRVVELSRRLATNSSNDNINDNNNDISNTNNTNTTNENTNDNTIGSGDEHLTYTNHPTTSAASVLNRGNNNNNHSSTNNGQNTQSRSSNSDHRNSLQVVETAPPPPIKKMSAAELLHKQRIARDELYRELAKESKARNPVTGLYPVEEVLLREDLVGLSAEERKKVLWNENRKRKYQTVGLRKLEQDRVRKGKGGRRPKARAGLSDNDLIKQLTKLVAATAKGSKPKTKAAPKKKCPKKTLAQTQDSDNDDDDGDDDGNNDESDDNGNSDSSSSNNNSSSSNEISDDSNSNSEENS